MDALQSNLKLLEPVLAEFASVPGSLITILQKAQGIFRRTLFIILRKKQGTLLRKFWALRLSIPSSALNPLENILLWFARERPATLTEAKKFPPPFRIILKLKAEKPPKTDFSPLKKLPVSAAALLRR